MSTELICLKCTLPICDEASKHCLYQLQGVLEQKPKRERELAEIIESLRSQLARSEKELEKLKGRRLYYRYQYALNRAKKIEAAKTCYHTKVKKAAIG